MSQLISSECACDSIVDVIQLLQIYDLINEKKLQLPHCKEEFKANDYLFIGEFKQITFICFYSRYSHCQSWNKDMMRILRTYDS